MARGREPGKKNRTTPPLPLSRALVVAVGIADKASGMKVSKLTLAEIVDTTPTSSVLRDLVASSRLYGLTSGGINAAEFELTDVGEAATSADAASRDAALKSAVMAIPAYKAFSMPSQGESCQRPPRSESFLPAMREYLPSTSRSA